MNVVRLLLLASLAFALAAAAAAQDRAEVAVGGVLPTQPFGEPWTVQTGAGVRLVLPVHGGLGDAVLRAHTVASDDAATPGFRLVTTTLGWGPTLRLGPASVTGVARLGAATFWFDDDVDVPQFAGNEREVEVALGGALRAQVAAGRFIVWAEGEALRIALREPVTLPSLNAGIAVRVDIPPFVRRLLDE